MHILLFVVLATLPLLRAFEDPRDVAVRAVDKVSIVKIGRHIS